MDVKWDGDNKNATLTLVAKYDYNDTTLQKIIDQIKGNDQDQALDFVLNGNYPKAGVVARIIRGQTLCCHLPAGGQESLISSRFSPHLV